jgi:hypothetical protein
MPVAIQPILPNIFIICCLIKHRDKIISYWATKTRKDRYYLHVSSSLLLCKERLITHAEYTRDGWYVNQRQKKELHVGFKVLNAVVMNRSVFWDITPGSQLKLNERFGGICGFYLQGRRMSQANRLRLLRASRSFLAWIILLPWRERWHVPPKRRLTFNGLHGVMSQKIELFKDRQIGILEVGDD